MSIDIIVEVMDHAPPSLTPAERYALLVLAEDARLPSREIKHDITDEYLLARLRMSERSWLNMRGELVKKKAIEKVEGGHNGRRARYRIPIFNEAMKGHQIGDPTTEDASELGTGFGDPTPAKGHRFGESRVTDSVTLTYIPRITPGGTTPTTKAAAPATPVAEGGGGGSIDQKGNPHDEDARRLIAALPATHRPGRGGATKLTETVAQLLTLGWPEDALHAKLAADLPPTVGNLAGLLTARLPDAVEYHAAAPVAANGTERRSVGDVLSGRRGGTDPCGKCDPIDRRRELDGRLEPCPVCNPTQYASHTSRHGDRRSDRQRAEDDWNHANWQWEQDKKRGVHRPRPVNAPDHLYEGLL